MKQLTPVRLRLLGLALLAVLAAGAVFAGAHQPRARERRGAQSADLYRRAGDSCVYLAYLWMTTEAGQPRADTFLEFARAQYLLGLQAEPGNLRLALSQGLLLQSLHRTDQAQEVLRTALKSQRRPEARAQIALVLNNVLAKKPSAAGLEAAWKQTQEVASAPLAFAEAFRRAGSQGRAQEVLDQGTVQAEERGGVLIASLAAAGLIVAAGLVGLFLFVFLNVQPGRVVRDAAPPSGDWSGRDAVEALLVFVLLQLALGALLGALPLPEAVQPYLMVALAGLSGLGAVAWVKLTAGRPTRLGWRMGHPVRKVLVGFVAGGAIVLPALGLAELVMSLFRLAPQEHPLVPVFGAAGSTTARVVMVLGACVLIPALEETLFRGVLYGALRRHFSVWLAALASAVVFAAGHLMPGYLLAYVLVGFVLAWLYERTGSLLVSTAAHAAFNAFSMAVLLFIYR